MYFKKVKEIGKPKVVHNPLYNKVVKLTIICIPCMKKALFN